MKVHSEWSTKPLSEFGQKLAPASLRGAIFTFICLIDERRRHEDHILGTMHANMFFLLSRVAKHGYIFGKVWRGVSASWRKKTSILKLLGNILYKSPLHHFFFCIFGCQFWRKILAIRQLKYQFGFFDNCKTGFPKYFYLSRRLLLGCSALVYKCTSVKVY